MNLPFVPVPAFQWTVLLSLLFILSILVFQTINRANPRNQNVDTEEEIDYPDHGDLDEMDTEDFLKFLINEAVHHNEVQIACTLAALHLSFSAEKGKEFNHVLIKFLEKIVPADHLILLEMKGLYPEEAPVIKDPMILSMEDYFRSNK